jgi:hypothetical protein
MVPNDEEINNLNAEIHFHGCYKKWIKQEDFYYCVENTGFKAKPFWPQDPYNKYNGIDNKIDDLDFYATFIKFGKGRASYDASH